jgi:competence protein ComGC
MEIISYTLKINNKHKTWKNSQYLTVYQMMIVSLILFIISSLISKIQIPDFSKKSGISLKHINQHHHERNG